MLTRQAPEENGTQAVRFYSAKPILVVRDALGRPLAGRYCTVSEAQGLSESWADLRRLEVTIEACGPSNENGEMAISGLVVRGGATRMLRLVVLVEGIEASLSVHSFWRDDSRLYYFTADQPTLSQLSLITLQGHDSVRLLALLAMPLFALNGRGMNGEPPHLLWRLAGAASFVPMHECGTCE